MFRHRGNANSTTQQLQQIVVLLPAQALVLFVIVLPVTQLEEKLPVTKENLCVPMFAVTPAPVVLAVLGLLTLPGILAELEALDFFEYLLYLD